MKLAYLILAHKNFPQLLQLINQLNHQDVSFIIHIDAKCDPRYISDELKSLDSIDILVIESRINVNWGGYSVFQATHKLINAAINYKKFDYISLISGQDFPIKSNQVIHDFLNQNKGKEFISYHSIPYDGWAGSGGLDRLKYYWLIDQLGWHHALDFVKNQVLLGTSRQLPASLKLYGGSMWFTISQECGKYISEFISSNPLFHNYFKYTMIPDELIVPSIVLNSTFKQNVVNDNLRYTDWSNGEPHPKTLLLDDFRRLKESNAHFARKFDWDVDKEIIQQLTADIKTVGQPSLL